MESTDKKLQKVIERYDMEGELKEAKPFGNGHINDTILLTYDVGGKEQKYVLQKINQFVFHHPDELMANMVGVTDHIRKKIIAAGGDEKRQVLKVLPASDGKAYCIDDDGEYWRVTQFISGATSYDTVRKPEDLYEAGIAFGRFQNQLSDYPARTLHETIPDFHNTRQRYQNFIKTVEEDKMGRAAGVQDEIKFILGRKNLADYSMESLEKGKLPLRVTHNDTKINNILIDDKSGKAICVLDLDTVMPGLAMTDFGDAIRSGACTAVEDEKDLSLVHLDLELYQQYARGFIQGTGGKLTAHEIETFPMGALIACYEQALRFLADYLEGDVYFKTDYSEHNLVRTRTQIRMVEEIEANIEKLQNLMKYLN